MDGWVSVSRKLTEHWVWDDKPFSKGQAWIDLIMMANHKENKIPIGGEIILIPRGTFITSELKLMERWEWSKSKVRLFLNQLQNDTMIVKISDHKKTTINIVNYGVYQDFETTERPKKNHKKTTDRLLKDTNNNVNNENNDNKILSNDNKQYVDDEQLNQTILNFIDFRKSKEMKSPLTDHGIELMIANLKKLSTDIPTQIAILNQSIVGGWKGIFPLKQEKQKQSDQPNPTSTNKFNQYPQRSYSAQDYADLEKQLINKNNQFHDKDTAV